MIIIRVVTETLRLTSKIVWRNRPSTVRNVESCTQRDVDPFLHSGVTLDSITHKISCNLIQNVMNERIKTYCCMYGSANAPDA